MILRLTSGYQKTSITPMLVLPTPASIRSYDMFYNLPMEPLAAPQSSGAEDLKGGTAEIDPPVCEGTPPCDLGPMLFSLPNVEIDSCSVEVIAPTVCGSHFA